MFSLEERFKGSPALSRNGMLWSVPDGCLRGQDHGHRVVQDTFAEEQSVEIHVDLQLVEDGQDGHCEQRRMRVYFSSLGQKKWPILHKNNQLLLIPTNLLYLWPCDCMINVTQHSNCITDDVTSKHASVLIYDIEND